MTVKQAPMIKLVVLKEHKERSDDKYYCVQHTLMTYIDETYKIYQDSGELLPIFFEILKKVKAIVGEGKSPNQAQQSWRDQYAEIMKKSKYKYEILAEENEQEENKVVN